MRELLQALAGARRVAVVTHRGPDDDAVGCAYMLAEVLRGLGMDVAAVVCPGGRGGCEEEPPEDVDAYVLVDVASLSQVPPLGKPVVVVDHHAVGQALPGVRREAPSCSELAYSMAVEAGVTPSRTAAAQAARGIYADTLGLAKATPNTLEALAALLRLSGAERLEDVLPREERRLDAVIAALKAAKRAEAYLSRYGVICTAHVGAHESQAASALMAAGCDVAMVASARREGVRLVMRSREYDVASLAAALGPGGGHRGAAVVTLPRGSGDLRHVLREVVHLLDPDARPLVQ